MNFLEYLEEDTEKDLYILVNVDTKIAPSHNGDNFETWAVSPKKAYHQILNRLRKSPIKFLNAIAYERNNYDIMTWDKYQAEYAPKDKSDNYDDIPHIMDRGGDQQLDLFGDR